MSRELTGKARRHGGAKARRRGGCVGVRPSRLAVVACMAAVPGWCGAASFGEAPMLRALVEAGQLPPVEQRLPAEPAVVDTGGAIGRYGGQMEVLSSSVADLTEARWMLIEPLLRFDADGRTVVPNVARRCEMSEEGRCFTIELHAGMRWSDGVPVTVADVLFTWHDVIGNEQLSPVPPSAYVPDGTPMTVEPVDDHTFRLRFAEPYGALPIFLTHSVGGQALLMPAHHLKQFHVRYADPEALAARVRAEGFDQWYELFAEHDHTRGWVDPTTPPGYPTLAPWRVAALPAEGHVVLERNPYYWKVDRAGNQLPYIDRIHSTCVLNPEANNLKLISGEVDYAASEGGFGNTALYLGHQRSGGYRVLLWEGNWGSRVGYYLNQTHRDPVLRRLFQQRDFRIALSLGINRDEMNKVLYYGRCAPRQVTANRASSFHVREFETAYTAYDPDTANRMLDQLGLARAPGGRWRRRPDGRMLTIVVDALDGGFQAETAELIKEYWEDLGIHMVFRIVDGSLFWTRFQGNAMDLLSTPDDVASDVMILRETAYGVQYWAPLWGQYLNTDGRNGEKPPPEVMRLYDIWRAMRRTTDEARRIELGRELLRSQAENLWGIGTVGRQLWPILVSDRLRNVPEHGWFGYPWLVSLLHHPEQYFLVHD